MHASVMIARPDIYSSSRLTIIGAERMADQAPSVNLER